MITIDLLREFGANVDEGLERCLNNEDFYLQLVPSVLEESYYKAVDEAVAEKDLDKAFDASHALKGILANLAITPIYQPVEEMTEKLRAREDIDYSPYVAKMWEQREKLIEMIG